MIVDAAMTAASDTQVVDSITLARTRKAFSVEHSLPHKRNGSTTFEKASVQSSPEWEGGLAWRLRIAQDAAQVGDGSPVLGEGRGQLIGDVCVSSRSTCLFRADAKRANFSLKLALSSVFCSTMSSWSWCSAWFRLWIPPASHLPKVLHTSRSM